MHAGRRAVAGAMQHRRPEQSVEVDDVLADEVMQFGVRAGHQVVVVVDASAVAIGAEAGQIADRRIQPDIEVLARRIRNFEAEIRRVARDVPGLEARIQPFAQLGAHARMRVQPGFAFAARGVGQQCGQEFLELAEFEEVVLGGAHFRPCAGHHRVRILQIGGRVGGAAVLAVVAVLVGGAALGALALDVAVGQEHRLDRIVELLHRARADGATHAQRGVDRLGDRLVLGTVRRVVVIEGDAEFLEVAFMRDLHRRHEGFRRESGLLGGEHDRRAVGVVGTHVVHGVAHQALRAYPDVGLDVADQMAQVQMAIGVGQGGGNQDVAAFHVLVLASRARRIMA